MTILGNVAATRKGRQRKMENETMWSRQLRLPVQAAPIDRTPRRSAALSGDSGVEASQFGFICDLLPSPLKEICKGIL
jgi:hypothetical protein